MSTHSICFKGEVRKIAIDLNKNGFLVDIFLISL